MRRYYSNSRIPLASICVHVFPHQIRRNKKVKPCIDGSWLNVFLFLNDFSTLSISHFISARTRATLNLNNHQYGTINEQESQDQDSQLCRLPVGSILGFVEYGASNRTPPFLFHRFLGARLGASCLHNLLSKRNIRVIAPERFGVGLSTF
jgi:hypothetical protein